MNGYNLRSSNFAKESQVVTTDNGTYKFTKIGKLVQLSFYANNVTIHDYRATPDLLVAAPFTPNMDYLQPLQ